MRMASGWRSTPFRLRCRSATRSRRLMAAARTGRACGWLSSMVALPPIAAANGPTSMACATTWSAANPDRKALLCCRAVGWSNAALGGLRIGAACCATAPDGWMSQPGVSPSSPFCLVFRHCSIQCQSVPLDYENPTQTGSEQTCSLGNLVQSDQCHPDVEGRDNVCENGQAMLPSQPLTLFGTCQRLVGLM